jgi:hypothetical protein
MPLLRCAVEPAFPDDLAGAVVPEELGAVPLGCEPGAELVFCADGTPESPGEPEMSLLAVTAPPTMTSTAAAASSPTRARVSHGPPGR